MAKTNFQHSLSLKEKASKRNIAIWATVQSYKIRLKRGFGARGSGLSNCVTSRTMQWVMGSSKWNSHVSSPILNLAHTQVWFGFEAYLTFLFLQVRFNLGAPSQLRWWGKSLLKTGLRRSGTGWTFQLHQDMEIWRLQEHFSKVSPSGSLAYLEKKKGTTISSYWGGSSFVSQIKTHQAGHRLLTTCVLFVFGFFMATPMAYGSSWARDWIPAIAAISCGTTRPFNSLCQILNPQHPCRNSSLHVNGIFIWPFLGFCHLTHTLDPSHWSTWHLLS